VKSIEEIKSIIESHKDEILRRYGVIEIGIFGSYMRGEQKAKSDIDVLVEFEKPVSLLDLVSLENYLSDILVIKVDLVPKNSIRPELKEDILAEALYI
jgi:uncharacterized protein